MKMKKSGCKIIVFSLVLLIFIFSAFSAFAVPEGEEDPAPEETYASEEIETEAPPVEEDTEAPEEETYIEEETYPEEETYAEEETEPVYYEEETEAPEEETYAVLDNDLDDLPEADTAPHPTAPRTKKAKESADMTYGIISWACVIVGVLTVIIVILSNKSGYYGGSGKQRYDEGNKITGKKRLLNDDYYTSREANRYQDRDNYR